MKSSFRIFVALLAGICPRIFAVDPTPHETNEKIFIVVQEKDKTTKELALDKGVIKKVSEITEVQPNAYLAMTVLTVSGLDCCPPIEKLSDTVWKCCDGTKTIVTNNPTVAKMLTSAHELKRADWENYKEKKSIMALDRNQLDKLLLNPSA